MSSNDVCTTTVQPLDFPSDARKEPLKSLPRREETTTSPSGSNSQSHTPQNQTYYVQKHQGGFQKQTCATRDDGLTQMRRAALRKHQ